MRLNFLLYGIILSQLVSFAFGSESSGILDREILIGVNNNQFYSLYIRSYAPNYYSSNASMTFREYDLDTGELVKETNLKHSTISTNGLSDEDIALVQAACALVPEDDDGW